MNFVTIITDDDPVIHFLHKMIVMNCGLSKNPLSFFSAKETMEYLDQHHGSKQSMLILLDINMPEMNGWQFLDMLDERGLETIYVIIVSSSVNEDDRRKSDLYRRVIGYLEKPISETTLKTLLNKSQSKMAMKIQTQS